MLLFNLNGLDAMRLAKGTIVGLLILGVIAQLAHYTIHGEWISDD